jgi:O-antigen/teichoic acid export membrane protein
VQVLVFARLFTPADIGAAALAGSCVAIISVFANFGFNQSVIRDRSNNTAFSNTAFSLSLLIGTALFFVLFFGAPLFSKVVAADLTQYIRFLAVMVLGIPLRFPGVFWEKELRFGHPSVALLIPVLVQLLVSVAVEALYHAGIWSLLMGSVTGFLCSGFYIWACAEQRPKPQIDFSCVREIFSFGTPLMLQGANSEAMSRGDNLMVGAYAGTTNLAYYNFAWQLPMMIASFTATLDAMLFPVYARLNTSRESLLKLFNLTNKLWSVTGSFIGFFIIVYADSIVHVLYGPKWAPVIPLLQIMTLSFVFRFCSGYAYDNLAMVRGRTSYLMKWGFVNTLLIFTLGLFMIKRLGPGGGAWFWVVQAVVLIPLIRLPLIYQELRSFEFLKHIWQPVASGMGAGVCGFCLNQGSALPVSGYRATSIVIYCGVYVVLLFLFDRKLISDIKKFIRLARQ